MMTTLWILFFAVVAVYVLPQFIGHKLVRFLPEEKPEAKVEPTQVRFYSGPVDGEVMEIPAKELPHYYVMPYIPRDENGMPDPPEENIVHTGNGMMQVRPSIAYYQQITDNDYIYVRDISESELTKMKMGLLPAVEKKDE